MCRWLYRVWRTNCACGTDVRTDRLLDCNTPLLNVVTKKGGAEAGLWSVFAVMTVFSGKFLVTSRLQRTS